MMKARLSLDQNMATFLSDISVDTLGVWKALLLPRPVRNGTIQATLSDVAKTLAQRHFEDTLGIIPGWAVLCELLELLILGFRGEDLHSTSNAKGDGLISSLGALFPSDGRLSTRNEQLAALSGDLEEQHQLISKLLLLDSQHASSGKMDAGQGDSSCVFSIPTASCLSVSSKTAESASGSFRPEVARRDVLAAAPPAAVKRASRLAGLGKPPAVATMGGMPTNASSKDRRRPGAAKGSKEDAIRELREESSQPQVVSASVAAVPSGGGRRKATSVDHVGNDTVHTSDDLPSSITSGSCSSANGIGAGCHINCDQASVLLVLGPTLHAVPWEVVPGLKGTEFYRSPSLALSYLLAASCKPSSALTAAPAGCERSGWRGSHPPLDQAKAVAEVDLRSTFYLLNPGGL